MKKKSILIIGNYPPPFGGVPRHIEYLAPYLVEKGWDVHVLSGGYSGIEYKNGITIYKTKLTSKIFSMINYLFESKRENSFKLRYAKSDSVIYWLKRMAFISIGRKIIEKKGISIICAYNLYSYAPIGAVLSKEYGVPLAVTNFGEIYSNTEFLKKNIKIVNYVCNVSKKLLAMSNHCAESYKLLGLSPIVEVIPYGVDISRFSPKIAGSKIRNKLGINSEDKLVLYVGRLIRDMGLHTLLESIPQVIHADEKIKFLIVGEKGELLPVASQLSEKYKKNIFLMPNVPFEELPLYYAASTIVVAPTQGNRACGSLASIEAMSTGKPVIASNVGGIPEIVIDGETGVLVPPEDSFALIKAVLSLLKDESLIEKMGKLGRERVEKIFDERKTDQKIEQIFEKLLEGK